MAKVVKCSPLNDQYGLGTACHSVHLFFTKLSTNELPKTKQKAMFKTKITMVITMMENK